MQITSPYTRTREEHLMFLLEQHFFQVYFCYIVNYTICKVQSSLTSYKELILTCKCPKPESEPIYLYSCIHYSLTEIYNNTLSLDYIRMDQYLSTPLCHAIQLYIRANT